MDKLKVGDNFFEEPTEEEEVSTESAKDLDSEPSSKEDSKSTLIIVLVIIGIFVLIIAGFKVYGHFTAAAVVDVDQLHQDNLQGNLKEEEGYLYNGFSFVKADGLWWTEVKRFDTLVKIPLHFAPKELEDIPIKGSLSPDFNNGLEVYIAIDPKVQSGHYVVAMRELSANIGKGIDRTSVGACIEEYPGCEDRKILSCNNTKGLPVVELELAAEPSIEYSGICIKVKGSDYGIIKAVDLLLYQWYGAMN
ncbi:MAG: hypothetical protein KKA62_06025 [Nanoarchaeota archaeon]|nr:hypothetical protein [Nanoarchaeota archaeon]MBU1643809.1 hypothetical protein [Nanoarchaeota archaeon]MBU1977482.1 hypothetical protein [Nanoarchaeota archaeon]